MLIIGLASQAQHGKDTAADYLRIQLNKRIGNDFWQRVAFAKNVKKVFCDTFNKDFYFVEKWKVIPEAPPDIDMPVRKALQFIGDGFREIKSTIWVDLMFRDNTDTPRIISDCRYFNELKAINNRSGLNILVVRPDKMNNDPNGSEAMIKPLLEWAIRFKEWFDEDPFGEFGVFFTKSNRKLLPMNDWTKKKCDPPEGLQYVDFVVYNDGTLEELYATCDLLVENIELYFNTVHNIKGKYYAVH